MKPEIQSVHNPLVKRLKQLRDSSHRRKSGRFLIDGVTEINRALENGWGIECIYHLSESSLATELMRRYGELNYQPVSPAVMDKIAYGERTDEVVAEAVVPSLGLNRLRLPNDPLVLVLDALEKPGNLGACIRTAAATGVDAVILTDPICDPFNPNAIRASRGSLFAIPMAICSVDALWEWCDQRGIGIVTGRPDGALSLWEVDFGRGVAIVMGNEAQGLGPKWHRCASFQIPMKKAVDSLNVSISSAVTLYEAMRQRSLGRSR